MPPPPDRLTLARCRLDREFGKGYTREHPELLGAYLEASSAALIAKAITDGLAEIAAALHGKAPTR